MKYAIIADNEVRRLGQSYDDLVGDHYTFPPLYKSILTKGTIVIYQKNKEHKGNISPSRLSPLPHYFGVAVVEDVFPAESDKKLYIAKIKDYVRFSVPVLFRKKDGTHYEPDVTKADRVKWRNGVREISSDVYNRILMDASINIPSFPSITKKSELEEETTEFQSIIFSGEEGGKIKVYSTKYERKQSIRKQVLKGQEIKCCVCGFDFAKTYGELGKGFIHVHHNKPLHLGKRISYKDDFDLLCPNCHAMVHRTSGKCLSVEELKALIGK